MSWDILLEFIFHTNIIGFTRVYAVSEKLYVWGIEEVR